MHPILEGLGPNIQSERSRSETLKAKYSAEVVQGCSSTL